MIIGVRGIRFLAAAVLLVTLDAGRSASAGFVVDFTYSGSGSGTSATGTGSFTVVGGSGTINQVGLSDFSFTETLAVSPVSPTYTFGLGDITSFSVTIGSGPSVTALSLMTDFVGPTPGGFVPQLLIVNALGNGNATTNAEFSGAPIPFTIGAITITSVTATSAVPEPSSLVLMCLSGVTGLGYAWRRRRVQVAA